MLLGQLLDGMTENRMLVLADGPLNGVPFASLPVPRQRSENAGRSLRRSATRRRWRSRWATREPPATRNTRVAVVSDPVYAAGRSPAARLPRAERPGNLRGAAAAVA